MMQLSYVWGVNEIIKFSTLKETLEIPMFVFAQGQVLYKGLSLTPDSTVVTDLCWQHSSNLCQSEYCIQTHTVRTVLSRMEICINNPAEGEVRPQDCKLQASLDYTARHVSES